MKTIRKGQSFVVLLFILVLLLGMFVLIGNPTTTAYAESIQILNELNDLQDSEIENLAHEFLQKNYELENLQYETLTHEKTVALYCDTQITGYQVFFARDNQIDYVIIENKTRKINEFNINCSKNLSNAESQVEYLGNDDFFVKKNGIYTNILNGQTLTKSKFEDKKKDYIQRFAQRIKESAVNDGSAGMSGIPWYANERVYIMSQDFLPGITYNGMSSNISFYNQNDSLINTPGNCGPTSMLNLFKYYNDLGYVSKTGLMPIAGNYSNTYRILANLSDYDWTNGGSTLNSRVSAVRKYAKDRGFSYDSYNYPIPTFNKLKNAIGKDKVCMLSMHVNEKNADGSISDWGHAVLGVGYRVYGARIQRGSTWVEEEWDHFVRAIDGWYSNSARYVNYDFYDIRFCEFKLKV